MFAHADNDTVKRAMARIIKLINSFFIYIYFFFTFYIMFNNADECSMNKNISIDMYNVRTQLIIDAFSVSNKTYELCVVGAVLSVLVSEPF